MVGVRVLRKPKIVLTVLQLVFIGCSRLVLGEEAPGQKPSILQRSEIEVLLSHIPTRDRDRISYFFRQAIFWDTFGYVLLGDKPCSITQYQRLSWHPRSWLSHFTPHNIKMKKGWNAWKKYEFLFPHPQFVFLEEDSSLNDSHFITLVHAQEFFKQVEANQSDFKNELNETNSHFLLNQGSTKRFFAEVLKAHDGLIGTVLGYGRTNAWCYYNNPTAMETFAEPEERARMEKYFQSQVAWKFFTGTICRDFSDLFLPGFKVQSDSFETCLLKKKYSQSREKIKKVYKNKDFLITTIQLLSNP
jgi:hypothetical protein